MSGFFITFEGGEGSGKTTQINKLARYLTENKRRVVTTREPGGTKEAEKIREFIVQRDGGDWSPMAECLLLFAAREMHVRDVIAPTMDDNKIVISDRFADSTLAYQGYGHGLSLEKIFALNDLVLGGLKPDLTFILDVDPEAGLQRSDRRLASESLGIKQTEDRFESLDLEFHKRLRAGFLEIAKADKDRCVVLDAMLPIDELTEKIIKITTEKLG